jgi:hypothetical protein
MEQLLLSGEFYEAFARTGQTRQQAKDAMYPMLFGRVGHTSRLTRAFSDRFPSYMALMNKIKEHDHKQLAIRLQEAEAKIIFEAVELFAKATGGKAPILTVHDALATTPDHLPTARDALTQTLRSRYGIVPLLKNKSPFDEAEQQHEETQQTP